MTFLKPTETYTACGVLVKKRIIPFGTKATKDAKNANGVATVRAGGLFKADKYFIGGKPTKITIHNTPDVKANGTTKSEIYSRATWPNENMGEVRVQYYVDESEAWQNLEDNEVAWHAGTNANSCSIAIEIIGNNPKAEENGARLAAYLLNKYKLDLSAMVTHKSWTGKNCPVHILPHWDSFVGAVKKYLAELRPTKVKITATKLVTITRVVDNKSVIQECQQLASQGYAIKGTETVSE